MVLYIFYKNKGNRHSGFFFRHNNGIIKFMETIIRKVDKNQIEKEIMEQAGRIIREGGLVAFPTETVYGLGANALDEEAAKKTFR